MKNDKYIIRSIEPQKLEGLKAYVSNGTLDLTTLVIEIDSILIDEGFEPFQRPLNACSRIADKLGIAFSIGAEKDDFLEAVHFIYESLYRPADLYMPPMHIGTVMFRDIFLPLKIPVVYGTASVDPIKSLDGVPENTVKWMFQSDDAAYSFTDQWVDLLDFVYGLDDISKLQKHTAQAVEFWQLAKQQLEGAAATLLGSIDKYTVIQNSIIAIELLLKGALSAKGVSGSDIRKYGHKMDKLAAKVCEILPMPEQERVNLVVSRTPQLVERRYQARDYKRTEIGQIMMDAQFIAGEVLRQFSDRDTRSTLSITSSSGRDYAQRKYPFLSNGITEGTVGTI